MIVIDTSALMAILLDEPEAGPCISELSRDPAVLISAGTLTEALIVASRRNLRRELMELVEVLSFEIVPVTGTSARSAADAYERWGKGIHPAGLNFGDCFAYALAKDMGCKLLFVGDDFAQTDLSA